MSQNKVSIPIANVMLNEVANKVSDPIFVADTKSIEFSAQLAALSNFKIRCWVSVQKDPADPSSALSATNDFQDVLYVDEGAPASYNGTTPYTASGAASKIFKFNTEGVRWAWIELYDYVAGEWVVGNANLSDND